MAGIERFGELVLAIAYLGADGADDERRDGAGDLRVLLDLGARQRLVEHRGDAGGKTLLRAGALEDGIHARGEIGDRPRLAVEQQLLQACHILGHRTPLAEARAPAALALRQVPDAFAEIGNAMG